LNRSATDLATNLERPGGNVTGVTTFDPRQATAQLEFLRAVSPSRPRMLAKANQVIQ